MLLSCPNCGTGLEVPDGTAGMVRCPACKTVFAPPEPEPEPEPEPPATVRLTCPSCRSGLEVPAGTSAMVRCPACKSVFSPIPVIGSEEAAPRPKLKPKSKLHKPVPDEDEPPKKKRAYRAAEEEDEGKEKHPDFDPISEEEEEERRRRKRRPHVPDDELTPRERAERRRAFDRAAWGARLIAISLALFMISMLFVTGFFFQSAFGAPQVWIVTIAGFLGLLNWLCAAVGVGLCLSGPRAPGHWGYGTAAATAILVHFIFLAAVVSPAREFGIVRTEEAGSANNVRWSMLPTRLNATMFYLTAIAYPDEQGVTPRGRMLLSMITGVAEMVRTVLIMMFLSCLARAALDEELAGRCTRTAGIASGGPGLLALLIFFFFAFLIETNAGLNTFTLILFATVNMGVYSIINGVMLPAWMAARDVTDACEEPFQSLIPNL